MTREECENKILEKMKEIKNIYAEYNKDGEYLTISIIGNYMQVYNAYYPGGADCNLPICRYDYSN